MKYTHIKSVESLLNRNKQHLGSVEISKNYKYWVVINNNNKVIGSIGFSDLENNVGMLISCVVSKECRGKGIGNKLIKKAINYAKRQEYRKIILLTINPVMMILAIKCGFIPEGSLKRHFKNGEDMCYFSYFIN